LGHYISTCLAKSLSENLLGSRWTTVQRRTMVRLERVFG